MGRAMEGSRRQARIVEAKPRCVGYWRLGREEEPAGGGAHCARRGGGDGGAHGATREHKKGVEVVIDYPYAPPPIAICPISYCRIW
jgi:hypothetical protein